MATVGNVSDTIAQVEMSKAIGKNSNGSEESITTSFMNLMNGYNPSGSEAASGKRIDGYSKEENYSGESDVFEGSKTFSKVKSEKLAQKEEVSDYKITDEDRKAVADFEEKTADLIKEKLGVTDEELEEAMAELGLAYADLLDPTNVTSLAMKLTGAMNIGELLTTDGFGELMQGVEELAENLIGYLKLDDVSLKEFAGLIEQTEAPEEMKVTDNIESTVKPDANVNESVADETIVDEAHIATEEAAKPEMVSDVAEETVAIQSDVVNSKENTSDSKDAVNVNVVENTNEKNPQQTETEQAADAGTDEEEQSLIQDIVTESKGNNSESEGDSNQNKETFNQDDNNDFFENLKSNTSNNNTAVRNDFTVVTEGNATNNVTATENVTTQASYVDTENIISQIVTQARVLNTESLSSVEMQLNPENLGKMILQVVQEDEHITAKITTQNETVREAIQNQLADLRVNLNQQGIKVDAVEVTVSSHAFEENLEGRFSENSNENEQSNQRSQTRRNLNVNDLDDAEVELSESEALAANIMRDNGNSMDMHA